MIWIFIIILGLGLIFLVMPFIQKIKNQNRVAYNSLTIEIQKLIEEKKVEELARIIVKLELQKQYYLGSNILSGIQYKSFSLAIKVDKIRNKLRIEAGLGPLKNF